MTGRPKNSDRLSAVERVADYLEPMMRAPTVEPWPEDPEGFYYSSAYHHAEKIVALVSDALEQGLR